MKLLGKTKIYDIAKELGLTSKEVIEIAQKLNIEAKSHLSSLEDEEVKRIKENAGKEKTVKKEKSSAVKSSTKKRSGKKAKEVSVSKPADSQQDAQNKEPSGPQQLSLFDCYES